MDIYNRLTIELRGNNPEPDLHEINKLGLGGWELEEVRRNCKENKDTYSYRKKKRLAFILKFLK